MQMQKLALPHFTLGSDEFAWGHRNIKQVQVQLNNLLHDEGCILTVFVLIAKSN